MPNFLPGRSYLLTTSNWQDQFWPELILKIDRLVVDGAELTVKELRQVLGQLSEKPFGPVRALVITRADQLSDILQNTLLKALEEPPAQAVIVLQAPHGERFLPTVRSRLHRLELSAEPSPDSPPVLAAKPEALAKQLRSVKERSDLINLLQDELAYLRSSDLPALSLALRMALMERALRRLAQNCNLKLVIDAFLLHYPTEVR